MPPLRMGRVVEGPGVWRDEVEEEEEDDDEEDDDEDEEGVGLE